MDGADLFDVSPPHVRGFVVERILGRGGFAHVWAATREEDGAPVAIKIGRSDNPVAHGRFGRDAEALRRVGPPHVPHFYQIGRLDDGRPYLVMERLFGSTLAAVLENMPGVPDLAWSLDIADAVLAALEAVHVCGLIHRDIKPENIFLRDDPARCVALLDFGLTRSRIDHADASLTRTGTLVGTPEYMSPEQLRGEKTIDSTTDIYSFGVLLFEILTLRLPFVGDRRHIEHAHQALRPPRVCDIVPLSDKLSEITLSCLEKDPRRRPQTIALLRRALAEARADASFGRVPDTIRSSSAPRSASSSRSGPLLESSQRLMVLLVLDDIGSNAVQVTLAVTRRKGVVARQQGRRYVCVFSGEDMDSPARVAVRTAQELVDGHGVRAALHLATLTVRRDRRGAPLVYGAAVERPETWLPSGAWSGVLITSELALALPAVEVRAVSGHADFFGLTLDEQLDQSEIASAEGPLVGRDRVLDAISSSMAISFSENAPALLTLIGEHGSGKSRLAREALLIARRLQPTIDAITLEAEQLFAGGSDAAMRDLVARIMEVDSAAIESDPQGLCRERLGGETAAEVWPAIASLFRVGDIDSRAHSASLRLRVMRALAEAFRRRASKRPFVVVLDNAHWANDTLLDALEYATIDPGCALWVLVTAHPRLDAVRHQWGARAHRHDHVVLDPLDEEAGMSIAARLLLPAEYPPADALKLLWKFAGGNPACLVELVRTLKNAGVIRRRPDADSYYVATAEIEKLPTMAGWQWIASRQLDAMPPELAACVRFYSVLGVEFSREEVLRVQCAVELAGGASLSLDAGYALGSLVERGVFRCGTGDLYSFRSAVFRDSVYRILNVQQREAIHRCALDVWRASDDLTADPEDRHERIARHAAACGMHAAAAAAYVMLGDSARSRHRHVEADSFYTASLELVRGDDDASRMRALAGRGKVRYRMYQIQEALADVREARDIAARLGDDAAHADLLLEEARVLDFSEELIEQGARVDEARPLVERLRDPSLARRLRLAEGRLCIRRGEAHDAANILVEVAESARIAEDYETRVIALLLSPILIGMERIEDVERRLENVIELCAAAEDWLHLGAAYANRAFTWMFQKQPERAIDDLRKATQLAREVGNPTSERIATSNVAEILHWMGLNDGEALRLATRARVLEERFVERPTPYPSILLARIHLAGGNFDEAYALVAHVAQTCPPHVQEPAETFYRMLLLVLSAIGRDLPAARDSTVQWDEISGSASSAIFKEELVEVLYWRAWTEIRMERWTDAFSTLEAVQRLLDERPMWLPRFAELWAKFRDARPGGAPPEP
ncbi:MAG: protein kinase [Polyangiaceae bacterium]|nr:protein kinase [Polyangiaceae bacterium]